MPAKWNNGKARGKSAGAEAGQNSDALSVAQIKERLAALKIEIPAKAKKAELSALLAEAENQKNAKPAG